MSRPPVPRASYVSGLSPNQTPYPPNPNMSGNFGGNPNMSSHFPGSHNPSMGGAYPAAHPGPSSALSIPQSRLEPPPLSSTAGPMPGTNARPIHGSKKRLILTCDGTWLDADNGLMNGHKQPPSNVSRIGWAIKDTSRDGISQIVNYQAGVGSKGGALSRVVGGATGQGLKENVREAYTYIATNWREGDEIFLLGFSRGAFTARSVGGTIGALGLLTRKGLPYFSEIYEDLEHRHDPKHVSKYPDIPFPNKGPFDHRYMAELQRLGLTRPGVPIKAICCWDTVGSLGIPRSPLIGMMSANSRKLKEYEFYDTKLHPCVENAFQALALDEHRAPFSPAVWEKRGNDTTNLKQVWFPGVHSNVGGGYDDQEIANITLAWMMSRLEPFLDFRSDFLINMHHDNQRYYKDTEQKPRWWSFGEIYRSLKGIYAFTGSKTRSPGNYYRTDPYSGQPTGKILKNTNEYIHASVRTRVGLKGPGTEDRGTYNPAALRDWTFETEQSNIPGQGGNMGDGRGMIVWTYRGNRDLGDGQTRIPEAVLLETELALLRQSHGVEEYVREGRPPATGPGGHRRSRRSHANGGPPPPMMAGAVGATPPPMNGPYSGRRSRSEGPPAYDEELNVPTLGGVGGPPPADEPLSDAEPGRKRHRRRRSVDGRDRDRDRDRDKDRRRKRNSTRY